MDDLRLFRRTATYAQKREIASVIREMLSMS